MGLMAELDVEELGMETGVEIGTVWGWWGWDGVDSSHQKWSWGWNSISGRHGHPTLGQYPEGAPTGL